jgi:ribose 5-phosphate isomerase B
MKIILGADHGGYETKERIEAWLIDNGYTVEDVGADALDAEDDYVGFGEAAVKAVTSASDRVILFCRNGFGMSIVANRFTGMRCGVAFDREAVRKGRKDDNINCLAVPADYVELDILKGIIDSFLKQEFSTEEKYQRRLDKLDKIK